MTNVLFAAPRDWWPRYANALREALAAEGVDAEVAPDHPADAVDYIVYAPNGPVHDFGPFTRARAVLNLWAGVERVVDNPTLTVPLTRMVDPGMTEGMVEYVVGHVLRHHLSLDGYITGAAGWRRTIPPLARERRVGLLGLGTLGGAAATALAALNFDVAGWSRTPKALDGVACYHGAEGLADILARSEILVTLLPLTSATEGLLNAQSLARLPRGAVVVNPGRGGLIDDDALLAALDSGGLDHATLDVFRTEPLPPDHAFWAHPKVTVTPHVASETRPSTAARVIAANIRRAEAGEPLRHVVDRDAGY